MNIKFIQSYDIVIFGAKGDLSCRKLIPALYQLEKKKILNQKIRIIGVGRANWNNKEYAKKVFKALNKFCNEPIDIKIWNIFKKKLHFCNVDVTNLKDFFLLKMILSQLINIKIYYFAMPPNTFNNICKGLGSINYNNKPHRIIVEKPIGTSLASSKETNQQLRKYFQEEQIFRIDHYLGKETILNLLALRFTNPIFYNIWNNTTIAAIKITVAEQVGIEGRWKYFNQIGQTRDMVQNHLLQILSLITMSQPKKLNANCIREKKIKVLKSLKKIKLKDISKNTIRGQYTTGVINGKLVTSYLNEKGSDKNSDIETFVLIKANIDNKMWKGVPFYLKTGKRLKSKKSEIVIYFKNIPNSVFKKNLNDNYKNKLIIRLEPNEGIEIQFFNKMPDINSNYKLINSKLNFNYTSIIKNKISDAYERLLLESMKNDQSLFVSQEEIETSWEWIDSIINSWKLNNMKVQLYPSGTWGPDFSNKNIK